jgi:hypothetical protein
MQIKVDWQKPIELARNKNFVKDIEEIPALLDSRPGVYFFSRRFGELFIPFYIGESLNISARLKSHLESRKIADVLRGISSPEEKIKNGPRYFHAGYLRGNFTKENTKKRLAIVQRHIIREAISADYTILNDHLTTIKTHELSFTGSNASRGHMKTHYSVEV